MADELDLASERETIERDACIARARVPNAAAIPLLDCETCSGITQGVAKESCEYFSACVADWQKIQFAKRMNNA